MIVVAVPDAAAMQAIAAALAPFLGPGDVIRLDGELGAGKTTFTRGLGEALGSREAVTSPTFVLARTHPTASGTPLLHVDAYRLTSEAELDDLDLDFDGSITVVEWGRGRLPADIDAVTVEIERLLGQAAAAAPGGEADRDPRAGVGAGVDAVVDAESDDEPRTVRIAATGPRGEALVAAWGRASVLRNLAAAGSARPATGSAAGSAQSATP